MFCGFYWCFEIPMRPRHILATFMYLTTSCGALVHCYKIRILTSHKTVSLTSCSPRSINNSKHYAGRPLISAATPYRFDFRLRPRSPNPLRTIFSSCSPPYPFLLPGRRQIHPCQLLPDSPPKLCNRLLRNPSPRRHTKEIAQEIVAECSGHRAGTAGTVSWYVPLGVLYKYIITVRVT